MSTRLTKKLATEWRLSSGSRAATRRSSPAQYASITRWYISTANSRVMFTLIPSAISCSIAGIPSFVPGTFTITFGRSTRYHSRRASAIVPAVSNAWTGDTSMETKPSAPPEAP